VETRVKERLTGAVILVALIVVLVPELLSGPHGAHRAPARSADAPPERSFTVDLTDGPRKSSAAVPQSEAGEAAPAPTPVVTSAPPATDAAPAASASAASAAPAPAPQPSASAPQAARANAPHATPRATAVAQDSSGTSVAPRGRTHTQAAAATSGWAIQVGSFTSRENAERLASELRAMNFVASVSGSTTNGRKLYRVRVGPAPDRASAQALVVRLRAAGHGGSIVPGP
jgi:DedD protein